MKTASVMKSFYSLGTVNTIMIPECDNSQAVKAAAVRVQDINDKMSAYRRNSEISMLNEMAGRDFVEVSFDTMQVLKRAVYFNNITRGAFDITSTPLTMLWGIGKKSAFIPSDLQIAEAKCYVGSGIILDEANLKAMLPYPNQYIDLGGIAKGYAADEVRITLNAYGVKDALISLGGNIWAMGRKMGQYWKVGIQNPLEETGRPLGELELTDETVVTSGANEKFFIKNGVRYHHIIDPRSGWPAQTGLLSVSVVGKNSMDMDALATAVFILGMQKGTDLVKKMGAEAIFVDTSLNVFATNGLKDRFIILNESKRVYSRG